MLDAGMFDAQMTMSSPPGGGGGVPAVVKLQTGPVLVRSERPVSTAA